MNDYTTPPITMVVPFAPPSHDLNLGRAYEEAMRSTTSPWILLMDYDAHILTPQFYAILLEAIADTTRNWGLLTVMATRTGSKMQRAPGWDGQDHNILHARGYQDRLLKSSKGTPLITHVPHGRPISGHVLLMKREAWEKISPIPDGLLGVDWTMAQEIQRAGYEIGLVDRLVVYHFYRGDGNLDHLRRANASYINPYR